MVCRLFLVTNFIWRDRLRLKSQLFEEALPAFCVKLWRLSVIRLKFCSMRYFVGFYFLLLQSILMKLNLFNADFFRQHNLWIWSDHIFWILDIIFGRFRFSGYGPVFNDDLICIFIRLLTFLILWQEWHKQTSEINCDIFIEFTNWFLRNSDNAHGNWFLYTSEDSERDSDSISEPDMPTNK